MVDRWHLAVRRARDVREHPPHSLKHVTDTALTAWHPTCGGVAPTCGQTAMPCIVILSMRPVLLGSRALRTRYSWTLRHLCLHTPALQFLG
jgi:hypothetical protein